MSSELRYDQGMRSLIAATVAGLALMLSPLALAQINGVPASVSSIGFGGHFNAPPGVPASVTSIGPMGLTSNHVFFNQNCCFQSGFGFNQNRGVFHHRRQQFTSGFYPYAVPYPVEVPVDDVQEDQYNGGPTVLIVAVEARRNMAIVTPAVMSASAGNRQKPSLRRPLLPRNLSPTSQRPRWFSKMVINSKSTTTPSSATRYSISPKAIAAGFRSRS